MKISKVCLWLAVFGGLLSGGPAAVRAGTFSNLHFIGFSPDGKYLAFEQYGTGDGSGYPFARIYFVETAKNAVAGQPFEVMINSERSSEEAARRRARQLAAKRMRDFKIERGNTGKLLVAQLATDRTKEKSPDGAPGDPQKVRFNDLIDLTDQEPFFELRLKPERAASAACQGEDFSAYKFELTLAYVRDGIDDPKSVKILQKDARLPASRGCVLAYQIERVYSYKNKLAVFLRLAKPGYEGPDKDYMAVTGEYAPPY